MAMIEEVDRRLRLWAEALACGDGSGYPVISTLHPDWLPPSPGVTPTMKVSRRGLDGIHFMVKRLSPSLRAAIVARYLKRMGDAEASWLLGCATSTVAARIERAHRELAAMMQDAGFCNIGKLG